MNKPVTSKIPRLPLHSFCEFGKLRAIIVGSPVGANHPEIDLTFENFFQPPSDPLLRSKAVGPIPQIIIDEIEEDIAEFIHVLEDWGVEVFRPSAYDSSASFTTPYWKSSQLYSLMPRDSLLVVGDLFIEAPSPTRSRYFETFAFREIIDAYVSKGAYIIAAPKPKLTCEGFDSKGSLPMTEREIVFDAANCLRLGRDLFIDLNRTANRRAFEWLERTLDRFFNGKVRVHSMSLGNDHVDVTLIPLRPGVVLIDPEKVTDRNIPAQFKTWDKVIAEEVMSERDYGLPYPLASNDGIGRNVLMLDAKTVIADEIQVPLIRQLENRGFTVIPLQYRHGRTLGGSWHCITLDTHREGELVSYF